MVDFIAMFTRLEGESQCKQKGNLTGADNHSPPTWSFHVDGAADEQGCAAGLILISPELEHILIEYAIHLSFKAMNNEAEYEAFLARLRIARALGVTRMHVYSNSQLIVRQVSEEYQAKGARMKAYLEKVKALLATMDQ